MTTRTLRTALARGLVGAVLVSVVALGVAPPAGAATWHTMPAPARPAGNALYDVSCRTATRCVAVGLYGQALSGNPRPLALELVNGAWKSMSTPSFGEFSELYDVSCAATTSCIAVGRFASPTGGCCAPLVLSLSGGTWKRMVVPAPPLTSSWDTSLFGVSCTTTTHCVAVGEHSGPHPGRTFALTLDNGAWTITPSQNRKAPTFYNSLSDVSCANATTCVAVGYANKESTGSYTLALTLTNGQWKLMPSPRRGAVADDNLFESVSCPTTTTCVAVGSSRIVTPQPAGGVLWKRRGLIATLRDGAWKLEPLVNPTPAGDQYFRAVSCTSPTRCVVAGKFAPLMSNGSLGNEVPHLVELAGSTWGQVAAPSPGGIGEWLNGVSCRGAVRCIAAGWTQTDRSIPMILRS